LSGSDAGSASDGEESSDDEQASTTAEDQMDRLASPWTHVETMQAELHDSRRTDDIPEDEFSSYDEFVETTLSEPDELWSFVDKPVEILRTSPEKKKKGGRKSKSKAPSAKKKKQLIRQYQSETTRNLFPSARYFHFLKHFK